MTISNNPNIIQGILSLTIEPDHVYMDLLESAPFNRGKNKLYEGVAGNLVAYACKVSFQNGFDGYLSFTAKTKPIDHYIKTLGTVFFYSGTGWNPNKQMPSSSCNSLRGGFVSNESVTKDNYINLYNQIMIWNEGQLPEDWTIETFLEKHSSKPYNPDIANAFFRSGYIESWGRGITKMTNLCVEAGLPRPTFYYKTSGIWAVFQKDILNEEYLQTLELNDRQVKAVLYAKEKGKITNSEYQELNDIKKSVTATELQDLTDKGILVKVGSTGRGTKYILPDK